MEKNMKHKNPEQLDFFKEKKFEICPDKGDEITTKIKEKGNGSCHIPIKLEGVKTTAIFFKEPSGDISLSSFKNFTKIETKELTEIAQKEFKILLDKKIDDPSQFRPAELEHETEFTEEDEKALRSDAKE